MIAVSLCGLGVALGAHLTVWAGVGIAIAIPAIALISRQTGGDADPGDGQAARAGMLYGSLAGVGFALLFIALDRAGTHAGAWPLLPGQVVALILIVPFAWRAVVADGRPPRSDLALIVGAGALSGIATCCSWRRPDVASSRSSPSSPRSTPLPPSCSPAPCCRNGGRAFRRPDC
jgi:Na+/proline symporter